MKKRLINTAVILILLLSSFTLGAQTKGTTLRQQIETVREQYGVTFIYDSTLPLDAPYRGRDTKGHDLRSSLRELFKGTGLKWELNGNHVIVIRPKNYTLSGYIMFPNGETVINATVTDLGSNAATLSNEHGFYSLTLREGDHSICYSFIGNSDVVETIRLDRNITRDVTLAPDNVLGEVVVTADLNSPLNTTQTGKRSLSAKNFDTGYALLSSPDVVKTLQDIPGVASGTDLVSGLYVHGGGNDENLFMLDGTPLYHTGHLGGAFSSFNTDVIKNLDFYKSSFPARYGGRLSSVVDIRTKDGDMREYHGSFNIGLIDGRLQFEGPIKKDRTSFNIGLRRTWLDLVTTPILALRNHSKDEKLDLRFAFHDYNLKLTHIFSHRSRADISLFSGKDYLKGTYRSDFNEGTSDYPINYKDNDKTDFSWGNITASANWKYQFSPRLFSVFNATYTRHRFYEYNRMEETVITNDSYSQTHLENMMSSMIDDLGCRGEFDYRPSTRHHIRSGFNYLLHFYHPQSHFINNYNTNSFDTDTVSASGRNFSRGHELAIYAEDDITLSRRLRVNVGARYSIFNVTGKTFQRFEPRISLNLQLSNRLTFKTSYTEMSQFMHQISTSYLSLPTDYWAPSTERIGPSSSRQFAAGLYMLLSHNFHLNIEGYWKHSDNLIEYGGGNTLSPAYDAWENVVNTGRGRSRGIEIEAGFGNERVSLTGAYTLSWSERRFPDLYNTWYPDKFDNRHKINLNFQYRFKKGIDFYAAWTYHTGNRMTLPEQVVIAPILPGTNYKYSYYTYQYLYSRPNNVVLPAYSRFDIGFNFRKITKKGRERIWNISIYNATCRMNPVYATVRDHYDGTFTAKGSSFSPIIPSISYTLKF